MNVPLGTAPQSVDAAVLPAPTGPLAIGPAPGGRTPALSVVIPTLNESENIAEFLGAVRNVLDRALPGDYEVVVVDDDSPDRTWEIAAAARFPELRVVRRRAESGLARAVIRGWQASTGATLATINADFQHPPEVLARMVERLPGADLVLATRHADGGGLGDWGQFRRAASWLARQVGRLVLPEVFDRVSDPLSGCYMLRRAAIEGVELSPIGYKSLMEVLVRGRIASIHECGYRMQKRTRGKSKVRPFHPFQFIQHVLRLRARRPR